MNQGKILKSKYGEPDAVPVFSSDKTESNSRPYLRIDVNVGEVITKQTGHTCFVIWMVCLNESRIRKGKPFRLNRRIRASWEISDKRLGERLTLLQSLGWLEFQKETGKAPLIVKVKEK